MTLILTVATSEFVLQVGDRLVTTRATQSGPSSVFDPQSNKQVAFLCDNAVGVVGYAGAAFLGEQPTDDVIAEAIADRGLPYVGGRRGIAISSAPSDNTIDGIVRRLGQRLDDGLVEERRLVADRARNLHLVLAGWCEREGVLVPIVITYDNTAPAGAPNPVTGDIEVMVGKTDAASHLIATIPTNAEADARLARMSARLRAGNVRPSHADEWLVGIVRHVAESNRGVGGDTMSMVLEKPGSDGPLLRLTYRSVGPPPTVGLFPMGASEPSFAAPGTFTPWIVANGVAASPAATVSAETESTVGDLRVLTSLPDLPPGTTTAIWGSMPERKRSEARIGSDDE